MISLSKNILEILITYGAFWYLAWVGWKKYSKEKNVMMKKMVVYLVVTLLLPFAFGTQFGRVVLQSFPVIVPYAIFGLRSFITTNVTQSKRAELSI
jgi:hypothetical protein